MARRCSLVPVVLFSILLFLPAAVAAREKDKEEAKAAERKEKQLAKARELYEHGRYGKAGRAFAELAAAGGECSECLLGAFRAAAADGRFDEAVPFAGAVLDGAKAEDDPVREEVAGVLRQALESTGGNDPDVLWGTFDVLARLGRSSEIVRLAHLYLDQPAEKSLICAADLRPALTEPASLASAAEINEQLRGLGWDGPLLVSDQMRRPRLRNKAYPEGKGARMAGVVDRTGFLRDVRLVRPPVARITTDLRDRIRRAMFDPATYQGQRVEVCYPFSVKQATAEEAAKAARAAAGGSLYEVVRALDSVDAVMQMVEKAGAQIALAQRAAICAAQVDPRELNQRLRKADWQGPFLDDEEVVDPVPQLTPPAEYTKEAREAGVEGKVVLSAVIDENGRVVLVEPVERLAAGLTGQAMVAVKGWTFTPATFAGLPIPVCHEVTVELKLTAEPPPPAAPEPVAEPSGGSPRASTGP